MSVSMVSSSAVGQTFQRPQGPGKDIRQGIDSLKKAVESGDLTATQSAYESLSKLQSDKQSTTSSASSTSNSNDPLSKLLSSVGEALKSGDVSQVQQAFAQNGPPRGGPGGAGGPGGGRGGGPGGAGGPPPGGAGGSDAVGSAVGSLAQSLQSGDVSGAQDSLSALADLLKNGSGSDSDNDNDSSSSSSSSSSSGSTSGTGANSFLDSLKSNLSDLGSALSSGDLGSAQKLFASLTPRGSQGVDITA